MPVDIEKVREIAEKLSDYDVDFASGGKIHIKPSHRGKFTALLKRTGKTASWYKAHGTPAQKKMAVFALNARKWKHADGGFLQQYPDKNIFRGGGKGLKHRIATKVSEYTKGLITPEEALLIAQHPSDFSKYLNWDEDKVRELKSNFYNNFYPYGYDTLAGISALTGGSGQEEPIGTTLSERMARDYLFAEYLGIPQENRKEPLAHKMYEESPYIPSMGGDAGVKSVRFSTEANRNKAVEIYNDLMRNVQPLPGKKRANFKAGKQYVSGAADEAYWIVPGKSKSNFTVTRLRDYDFQKDPYSAALGQYVIGSGVDSKKGQYVSVYDKWDLNPISAAINLPRVFTKKVQDLGDLSGGFGNPVSFYDRVYLDDYYGVDSQPEADSYYGGYITPSYIKAYPDGGKIKGKHNGKFYVTELNDRRERKFQDWYANAAATLGLDPNPDAYEQAYDYRGYWLNNRDADVSSPDFHFPDTWKQPHHPTFSDESIYAKGHDGVGHWDGERFVPGPFNNIMQATEPSVTVAEEVPVTYGSAYTPSDDILQYIKNTEAFRDQWYQDGNGVWTVGYGFTGDDVRKRYPNGMTRAEADQYFADTVSRRIPMFVGATPNFDRLNQNQRDALFSYYYNIGHGGYTRKSPAMQEALKNFDLDTVISNIDFGYNDKKNSGLRKRRDYERKLFGTPMDYGGILNRLRNVYGDNDAVKAAILRAKNVKKS